LGDVKHLCAADLRRVPWKNGRGFTDQLALWPPAASFEQGDFDWRISKATVEQDGPFSAFPGFERVLVVTEGAGLVLDHGALAPRAKLERLVPYRFSGDWPTSATLVDGRVADFNVLCRRGRVRAQVEVCEGHIERDVQTSIDAHVLVHLLAGSIEARPAQPIAAGESLWLRHVNHRLELRGAGTALLVRILVP